MPGRRPGGDLGSDELEQSAVDLGSVRPAQRPLIPFAPRPGVQLLELRGGDAEGSRTVGISLPSVVGLDERRWSNVSARLTDQVPIRDIMLGKSSIMQRMHDPLASPLVLGPWQFRSPDLR